MRLNLLLSVSALAILFACPLGAEVIPPTGLAPGTQYQLIFSTLGTTDAASADINYYNTFVINSVPFAVANFGLPAGATWHAVASTPSVNARDNAPSSGLPVYNTAGQLVAVSSIYSGALVNAVIYDEIGLAYGVGNAAVWTGSDPTGVGIPSQTLGDSGGRSVVGYAGGAGAFWIDSDSNIPQGNQWAVYALSSPITFVPEPSTLTLAALGFAALVAWRWRRR